MSRDLTCNETMSVVDDADRKDVRRYLQQQANLPPRGVATQMNVTQHSCRPILKKSTNSSSLGNALPRNPPVRPCSSQAPLFKPLIADDLTLGYEQQQINCPVISTLTCDERRSPLTNGLTTDPRCYTQQQRIRPVLTRSSPANFTQHAHIAAMSTSASSVPRMSVASTRVPATVVNDTTDRTARQMHGRNAPSPSATLCARYVPVNGYKPKVAALSTTNASPLHELKSTSVMSSCVIPEQGVVLPCHSTTVMPSTSIANTNNTAHAGPSPRPSILRKARDISSGSSAAVRRLVTSDSPSTRPSSCTSSLDSCIVDDATCSTAACAEVRAVSATPLCGLEHANETANVILPISLLSMADGSQRVSELDTPRKRLRKQQFDSSQAPDKIKMEVSVQVDANKIDYQKEEIVWRDTDNKGKSKTVKRQRGRPKSERGANESKNKKPRKNKKSALDITQTHEGDKNNTSSYALNERAEAESAAKTLSCMFHEMQRRKQEVLDKESVPCEEATCVNDSQLTDSDDASVSSVTSDDDMSHEHMDMPYQDGRLLDWRAVRSEKRQSVVSKGLQKPSLLRTYKAPLNTTLSHIERPECALAVLEKVRMLKAARNSLKAVDRSATLRNCTRRIHLKRDLFNTLSTSRDTTQLVDASCVQKMEATCTQEMCASTAALYTALSQRHKTTPTQHTDHSTVVDVVSRLVDRVIHNDTTSKRRARKQMRAVYVEESHSINKDEPEEEEQLHQVERSLRNLYRTDYTPHYPVYNPTSMLTASHERLLDMRKSELENTTDTMRVMVAFLKVADTHTYNQLVDDIHKDYDTDDDQETRLEKRRRRVVGLCEQVPKPNRPSLPKRDVYNANASVNFHPTTPSINQLFGLASCYYRGHVSSKNPKAYVYLDRKGNTVKERFDVRHLREEEFVPDADVDMLRLNLSAEVMREEYEHKTNLTIHQYRIDEPDNATEQESDNDLLVLSDTESVQPQQQSMSIEVKQEEVATSDVEIVGQATAKPKPRRSSRLARKEERHRQELSKRVSNVHEMFSTLIQTLRVNAALSSSAAQVFSEMARDVVTLDSAASTPTAMSVPSGHNNAS